ncbi:hypothetical protein [Stenotrophomonas sp. HMWF003]|uniref:hypothetical protein n=1 Tax=Stenotrophomonas sp. HMWF003 TaxID=2056840 RepID=UPI000FE22F3A|nr:hypothetical protein [Stenotrophomonas sp. HMWF003]
MISPWTASWSPQQDRYQLRREFERWLPKPDQGQARYKGKPFDEAVLIELCRQYRLEYVGASECTLAAWDASPERISDKCPSSAELRQRGWLKFDGGRWARSSDDPEDAANAPLDSRTDDFLWKLTRIDLVERGSASGLSTPAMEVKKWLEDRRGENIPVKDALWLARRLWTELCRAELADVGEITGDDESDEDAESTDEEDERGSRSVADAVVDGIFLQWQTWCNVLHCPAQWDPRWSARERSLCREAALRVLDRQEIWRDWEAIEVQTSPANRGAQAADSRPDAERALPSRPLSLINRSDWLNRPDVQRLVMGELLQSSSIGFAFGLLCSEMEMTSGGTRIKASIKAVMDLVAKHPVAMQHLIFKVHNAPVLLVDMLLSQRTAPWATWIIMRSRNFAGALTGNRAISDTQARSFAIQESVLILSHQIRVGRADLLELSSLITWCYYSYSQVPQRELEPTEVIGRGLLGLMANAPESDQSVILQHLMDQAEGDWNPPRVCFRGVLDAAGILPIASHLDLSPVVDLYQRICRDLRLDWTDASWLPSTLCARLAEIGLSSSSSRPSFLNPIDARRLARRASSERDHSVQYSLAKTLRAHVQILARAIGGWTTSSIPRSLFDALLELISISVAQHGDKGHVPALTDRYTPDRISRKETSSPAQDLAQAWRTLGTRQQNEMLRSIAESDDPAFLAEFCVMLPKSRRRVVRTKIRSLGPTNAAVAWTWTEMERRIRLLLDADEKKVARQHLDDIDSLSRNAPPEVKLNIFDLRLRLLFNDRKWRELDQSRLPEDLDQGLVRRAEDVLLFWRATSQLVRPAGDLSRAKAAFERLAARSGSAVAYRENAYAAALRLLLDVGLDPLDGASRAEGEKLLTGMSELIKTHESELSSGLLANRGLLLLALGRPEEVLKSLEPMREHNKVLSIEHVAALAMSKLGRNDEARAVLDAAIDEFGAVSDLIKLKDSLSNRSALKYPSVVTTKIDALSSIQLSLQKMLVLRPADIGQLFDPSGAGLKGFLVKMVSQSLAALQHMGAILRNRGDARNEARCETNTGRRQDPRKDAKYENDLNTALKEILGARLAFIRWDVADQSLGGATERGNLGERDLVIRASGQEVAVLEALVCQSLDKGNIKAHFQKLFSYGKCAIYFHVIYSYTPLLPLLEYVGEMIRSEYPASLSYLGHIPLDDKDNEVAGFLAAYADDHREVDVVFLIVDLGRPARKDGLRRV